MSYILARYPNPSQLIPTREFYAHLGDVLGVDSASWDSAKVPSYETVAWFRAEVISALQSLA